MSGPGPFSLLIALSLGCIVPERTREPATPPQVDLQQLSSRAIDCPASAIAVSSYEAVGYLGRWKAACEGREYLCSSKYGSLHKCSETPESERRTTLALLRSRLSLETGCPKERVIIVEVGEWQRGQEVAARLTACDKPYVCSTAPGRADCKAALAAEAAGAPPGDGGAP